MQERRVDTADNAESVNSTSTNTEVSKGSKPLKGILKNRAANAEPTGVPEIMLKIQALKEHLTNQDYSLKEKEDLVTVQQLQCLYHEVLIRDLEYCLDQKVELDLWNYGFRNCIVSLQSRAKERKGTKQNDFDFLLTWFLESANNFYSSLLQDVCSVFSIDLPFRRSAVKYGGEKRSVPVKLVNQPNKNSCYYICQYCLVHLGDIARYRNMTKQAKVFYRHAMLVSPGGGHPYNQLALVEASHGDRLSTVFFYVRSISVKHPFPVAALNLTKTLNQCAEEQLNVEGRNKLSTSEWISVFLKFHGLLSEFSDLQLAENYVQVLSSALTALVATEGFGANQLVQMVAINLYALHKKRDAAQTAKRPLLFDDTLSSTEKQAKQLVLHQLAASLSALLLPVYTLKKGEALIAYFALPAVKVTLDWIRLDPEVLKQPAFLTRRQIWPSLCKLLNAIHPMTKNLDYESLAFTPLPEDTFLQCFIPLEAHLNLYKFVTEDDFELVTANVLRAKRLVDFGCWLSKQCPDLLKCEESPEDPECYLFEMVESRDFTQYIDTQGKVSSENVSDLGLSLVTSKQPEEIPNKVTEPEEKSVTSHKKGRSNVAMQAILKKTSNDIETSRPPEIKQVTFKTPTPTEFNVSNESEIITKVSTQAVWPELPVYAPQSSSNMNPKTALWPNYVSAESPPEWAIFKSSSRTSRNEAVIQRERDLPRTFLPQPDWQYTNVNEPKNTQEIPIPEWHGNKNVPSILLSEMDKDTNCYKGNMRYPDHQSSNPIFQLQSAQIPYIHPGTNQQFQNMHPWKDDTNYRQVTAWWRHQTKSIPEDGSQNYSQNMVMQQNVGEDIYGVHKWNNSQQNVNLHHKLIAPSGQFNPHISNNYITPDISHQNIGLVGRQLPQESPAFAPVSVVPTSSYSLFSSSLSQGPGLSGLLGMGSSVTLGQQSLWSGPGPSPLERLLEQQKQQREAPAPKGGT